MDWAVIFQIGTRAVAYRKEIARVQELTAPLLKMAQPVVVEFKRIQPELVPLVWTLIEAFFPELRGREEAAAKVGGVQPGVEFSVTWIQTSLNKLIDARKFRHSKIDVDGNYGKETSEAVEAYQRQKGFAAGEVDGWFGIQTLTSVVNDLES